MRLFINRHESTAGGTLSDVVLKENTSDEVILKLSGIECPWRDNKPAGSCIPGGDYGLVPHNSDRFPNVWAFVGGTVAHYPDSMNEDQTRYACLIHSANYAHQIFGCLAVGISDGETEHNGSMIPAVWNSRDVVNALREHLGTTVSHTAHIRWFDA